jgi:hypothetical protein
VNKNEQSMFQEVILFFKNPDDPKVQFDASTYESAIAGDLAVDDYRRK